MWLMYWKANLCVFYEGDLFRCGFATRILGQALKKKVFGLLMTIQSLLGFVSSEA